MTTNTRSTSLPQDFADFIAVLDAHRVEYALVGGYALGAHGFVRATADIDFLYRCSADNVTRLCAALKQFGAPAQLIDASVLLNPDTVTFFGVPPFRIDLLGSVSGISTDEVLATAIETTVDGQRVRVIGWDALLTNKKASGRDKDRRDVRALTKIAKARTHSASFRQFTGLAGKGDAA